ncbi:cellular retinoic acid-binding protein 2b isoform 1-T2 [Salvelinus alpinus]|uniref:cellular retinoic acid-binding protein 2-like isoform X1 n=1 Tax=Salvelinus alpinus TaxID=8036 RepID=UPI0039FD3431
MDRKIADFSGTWKMKTSENFEELLKALALAFVRDMSSIPLWAMGEMLNQLGLWPHTPLKCFFSPVHWFYGKIAVAAASRPAVEITQQGESLSIQTSTSVRTTHVSFTVGQSFNETTVDGRLCTSTPRWETDSKISCEQILQKGEGPKTAWTREVTNDGELILIMSAGDVLCTRVYQRE